MKHFLFLFGLTILLFVGCGTKDDDSTVASKDKYYVLYSANYDRFSTNYIKYRNENGDLVYKTIKPDSGEQKFEVGPVSSIFQAYIEGSISAYGPASLSIYVRKNDQPYMRVATIHPVKK